MTWVERKSKGDGLWKLRDCYQKQLVRAIRRARQEQLDFQPVELDAFELAVHYVFYHLAGCESPIFGRMPKSKYINGVRQLITSGQTIRVGTSRLSSLVSKSELAISEKIELAKLVEKLEAVDGF